MSFFTSPSPPPSKRQRNENYSQSQELFGSQFFNTQHSQQQQQHFAPTQNSQHSNFYVPTQTQPASAVFSFSSQFTQMTNFNTSISSDHEAPDEEIEDHQQSFNQSQDDDDDKSQDYPKTPQQQQQQEFQMSSQLSCSSALKRSVILDGCIEDYIPESVVSLYNNVKQREFSDWTFVSIIAGQLCTDIFPLGVYNNLKVALLMSLVSSPSAPLHIIAIGRETSHAHMVMSAMKFSQRFLSVALNYDGITVKKNDTIEAGPMSLATTGITYVGNWGRLPSKVVQKFLREIELGVIIVDKLQKNFPLQSAVWAYWSLSHCVKKDFASIDQFLNVFGVPIIFDDTNNETSIIDDLLEQNSIDPPERFNDIHIPDEDLRSYLEHVRNTTVEFDSRAEAMLRNYFIATKTIRPGTLTEKAYDVLTKFAAAHAKLSLRSKVMRQDVLVAINICEKFIKLLFDTDSYSSPNESKVTSVGQYDAYMDELLMWYSHFTKDILEKI